MPLYEYECPACEQHFEIMRGHQDPPLKTCPNCKSRRIRKLVSAPAFQFKGSGWYVTDYASSKNKADKSAGEKAGADGSSSADSGDKTESSKASPDKEGAAKGSGDSSGESKKPSSDKKKSSGAEAKSDRKKK